MPQRDQISGLRATEPRWLVLCLAMTASEAQSVTDAVYELHVDGEIFHTARERRLWCTVHDTTHCALIRSSTYLGRRVSKSMILAQIGAMRMSTICW